MLSVMEPALSPLPPSPDREGLGDSCSSEEVSGSGSSSEDDGSGNDDQDSDYSLGDLADMLIGDHGEGENLAATTMKTRSSDQDAHEDVENSSGDGMKTKDDADCEKTENESSVRQSPNEASASDVEFSKNLSLANCDVTNPESETSKALTMNHENTCSIEAEMKENLRIAQSVSFDRKKTDDESAENKEPSNAEKCTVATPSPQRKATRRMASPKPRVMTRSRAKAMKLSSSSDAESSSERETAMEVIQTQENSSEVSDTGLKRNSNASDIGKSYDGGSDNNEHVSSVSLVHNKNEFTEKWQANESQTQVERDVQGFLSQDSSSFDADDADHHHGKICEPICSEASLADLQDQEPTEVTSNVLLVGVETDVFDYQRNDGQLSGTGALLTDSEKQAGNEDNLNVLSVGMDTDAIHQQNNDGQLNCSQALLPGSEKQAGDEDNSNVLSVGMDTDAIHQLRNVSDISCSGSLLTDSEKQAGDEDNSNVLSVGMDTDAIHQQRNDSDVSCSGSLLTDSEKQAGNEDNSIVLSIGMDTNVVHQQRNDGQLSCSEALLTDSEKQAGNEDNLNVLSVGMDTDAIHQQNNDGQLNCSQALLPGSEKQAGDEDNSNVLSVGMDTDAIHQLRNVSDISCSGSLLTDSEKQAGDEDNSNVLSVGMDTDAIHQQRNDSDVSCSGSSLTDSEKQAGNEDNSIVLSIGMDTNVVHQQRNDGQLSCSEALLTDSEKQAGNEDNSNVLSVGLGADAIHQRNNDGQLKSSGALLTDSEKQAANEDNSIVLSVGMDTDAIHQQNNDGQLNWSGALLTDSEKQTGNEDNSNVLSIGMDTDVIHQQRNDGQLGCSEAQLTDSMEQVGNEDNSDVFTGGQEADGSRFGHSTTLPSEQVVNEDNSEAASKAAGNIPTEVEIDIEQEFSSTSESGSKIKGDAPLNMNREENPDINEIPSLELNNENADYILANKIISEINTEEGQTSQDGKITADVNGNTVLLQLETKENAFERREDNLEEKNNNVSEDFGAAPKQSEVGAALVVDADSSDQSRPFVRKTQNHFTCTTERKTSDGSELSATCDGSTNEDRLTEQVYFPSDEESDADSFPCVVPDKVPMAVETSKGEPADVSSSTVEVDFNLSTLTCEKETTMTFTTPPAITTTETTEYSSIKSHEVETSEDSPFTLEEGNHFYASDEAMQSCSIDEHEGKDSKGQESSVKENIPVSTAEVLLKNSELEKDESSSSDGEELSTCNDTRKNSHCVKVKDVPASKTVIEEASESSTSNKGRKNSDCVKDVPASKTAIKEARDPLTPNEGRKESHSGKCVSFRAMAKKRSSTCNDEKRHFDKKELSSRVTSKERSSIVHEGRKKSDVGKDVPFIAVSKKGSSTSNDEKRHFDNKEDLSSRNTSNESSSTVHEGRKNSDMGRDMSFTATREESCLTLNKGKNNSTLGRDLSSRADFCESPLTSIQRKKNSVLEKNVSSRAVGNESSSTFNEGRKRADMGRDVSSTATKKESCLTVGRDVSTRADSRESPMASKKRKRNSALERNLSSRAVGNENLNMGRRNSALGRDVSPRIIGKEGSSLNEKETLSYGDVREPSSFNEERKRYAIKRDVSSPRTVTEKAGERKRPSSCQLDAGETNLEERGTSLELPWSPNDEGAADDSTAACDPMDDSPIQTLFNNLECLLEEFPALSPLPPSPHPSDDEECSASPISSINLNKEKSNRVTDLTSAKKTFDTHRNPEFKRDQKLSYTEVASRSIKRTSLEKTATMCVTESKKLNISVTPRTCLAKGKTSESASTSCSRGNASVKPPLQRSISAPTRAGENVSLKRSYQQSGSEPVNNKDTVSQKSKKMKTQPEIPHKKETSSLEKRLNNSRVPVKKATLSQPSRKNGATKGSILVDSKGPIRAGNKEPTLAGSKGPIRVGDKGPIVGGDKEPILIGDDGPIVESNEEPVLEERSKNTNNSAKVTGDKHSKYRPLSVRPGYMPEVKYVFKCLSRVHEDNVDLHTVVERLTTKRCISSSTPVASAIIQFLKERQEDLIPQILDQLEHFQAAVSPNNWQPVISSFESRLVEMISLLSNDALFGNLIPRLVSLCSRSLTEARCSSNDEEVTKGELSLW